MIASLFLGLALAAEPPPGGWPPPPAESTVASVYDGDTVTLATGDKIRLRWVNTPELRPPEDFGYEAKALTERFVGNKRVTLVMSGDNPRDGYGRVVAGLDTREGSLTLQLLEQGLGHLFVIPPDDTDLTEMIAAQDRARAARLGIWSTDRYQGELHITSFHANAPGNDRENPNGEYLRVSNVSDHPVDLSSYVMTDRSGRRFALPDVVVPVGYTVKVHSGQGEHQRDTSQQLAVYLGSEGPVWNNDGDRATILDANDRVVDFREHAPRSR